MDRHTPEQRRKNMQAVKNKDSKIELMLRKELWNRGLRYQKNSSKVFGKPDIVFLGKKVAVFCDSEFWHGYDWDSRKSEIKSRQDFWIPKIERNMQRDIEVNEKLKSDGWTVLRFWGNDIKKNLTDCADEIEIIVRSNKKMKWTYFPRNQSITKDLKNVVDVFEKKINEINSENHKLKSDEVLATVSDLLEETGYDVERSKADADKIKMPVLYGENGCVDLNFEADAFNKNKRIVIEVEAGRAVTNYQFLKDFFEACCMNEAEYLCIAVREIYRNSFDYKKVCNFFEAMYASDRFDVPLKGILIIGY